MSKLIRVLLVDDQKLVREGLRTLLDLESDFEIVGEAANGEEGLALYESARPDVVLMDVRMPVMDGVEASKQMCAKFADARVLILTTFDDDEYVFEGLRAGALGYLLKDVSGEELANAVRVVAAGGSMMGPSVARRVLMQITEPASKASDREQANAELLSPLSEREFDILGLIAEGLSNPEIAQRLFLAEGTVKNYVSTILQKLDTRDRTQAVLAAQRLKLI